MQRLTLALLLSCLGACLDGGHRLAPAVPPGPPAPPALGGAFHLVVHTTLDWADSVALAPDAEACVSLRVTDQQGADVPGASGDRCGDLDLLLPCNPDAPAHTATLQFQDGLGPSSGAHFWGWVGPCVDDACEVAFTCAPAEPAEVVFDLTVHERAFGFVDTSVADALPEGTTEACYDYRLSNVDRDGVRHETYDSGWLCDPTQSEGAALRWTWDPCRIRVPAVFACSGWPHANTLTLWTRLRMTLPDGSEQTTGGSCPEGCSFTFDCFRNDDTQLIMDFSRGACVLPPSLHVAVPD